MDIQPSSVEQLRRARNGSWTVITAQEGSVARDLQAIDPSLRLQRSDLNGIYVVSQILEDGTEHLVKSSTSCDQRLVTRIRQISHSSYDYAQELNEIDARVRKAKEDASSEEVKEKGERLLHAMQKDLGVQNTVYLADKVGSRAKRKGLK